MDDLKQKTKLKWEENRPQIGQQAPGGVIGRQFDRWLVEWHLMPGQDGSRDDWSGTNKYMVIYEHMNIWIYEHNHENFAEEFRLQ